MQHNRKLHISTAGTRKTKHWPETEILWSEFVDRVKTPVRSTETVEEYLAMPKYRQDELKDVGGFVGGTFENNIRKAAYVKGRDLLTLDMDNIPAGGTDEILKRVSGLGCAALVYSTRKHAGYAPRLRVIVPLDATASADEYEPASRKLASLIGMEFCDPTTFDVSRLMYWPSCCKDGEYIFEVYDHPFCSLSGLLQMYGDWKDEDDAGFYNYMELFYGITGREKLDNALLIVSSQNRINDVKEYLKSLKWDGQKRLDTLLSVYLGAEDNGYTRAVMRKSLCAAVARAVTGGVKYDYMPIFTGPQGIGKSTFLRILGKDWFSDSLTSFEGKEAAELIQGTWINEVGELTAMTKQETNAVKQFLSKTDDIYRAAYGRRTNKYPRRCVFFGTSNEEEFLKDMTGNRRFWPVDVGVHPAKKSVWQDLPQEVDQIWAEAYTYWLLGEPLYMTKEEEQLAEEMQESHREASGKEGLIREFLERLIPSNWDSLSLSQRRQFYAGSLHLPKGTELVERDKVCAMEVWAECFNGDVKFMKKTDSMEINGILASIKGWKRNKSVRRYGVYGTQKGFERV